jgi:hypothetical protein
VIRRYHDECRAVALNPSLKRVVVGGDVVAPYLDFEIFAAAKHPVMTGSWEMRDGPQVTLFAHTRNKRQGADTVRKFGRDGYAVLSR